ncbi:BadF/BadG/BcrA/BcrD ATPase family protein [Thermus tenuipuniceus]|uniref:BadF/BadG/BcrA/BcrD ATPase family protein n=1 Tax=Thermus tenuipuniceus TaxID=2078690 RepID=UPI000CF89E4D|nr:BadF/BadG/BcrA/BcrD ATPase family protein [Thermus tenuipuniceus]
MAFVGVDGGGTKTKVVALDGEGHLVHERVYPTSYLPAVGEAGFRRLFQTIRDELPEPVEGAVLGLGGYGEVSPWDEAYLRLAGEAFGERVHLLNDVELAWWAAFDGEDGVVVIAGTGSMAYGRGPKGSGRAGGYGPLFGDEGSAYWIGLEALRLASKAQDGRTPPSALTALPRVYGQKSLLELLGFLQAEADLLRQRVAALAEEVDRLAGRDWGAQDVLSRAAGELHLLGSTLAYRVGADRVAPMGGVFRSALVQEAFTRRMERDGFAVVAPREEAALAAARMAARRFG